jgi:hypothetical protein
MSRKRTSGLPQKVCIMTNMTVKTMDKSITRLMAVDGRCTRVVVRKEDDVQYRARAVKV